MSVRSALFRLIGSLWAHLAFRLAGFVLAYALAMFVGMEFRTEPNKFALFWPSNGLLAGVLFVCRPRDRRWYTVAAVGWGVAGNLLAGNLLLVSLGFTAVNVGEPWLILFVIARVVGLPFELSSAWRVLQLFGVVLSACAVTAVGGAAVVTYGLGAGSVWSNWQAFWLSDVVGTGLTLPLVLSWATLLHPHRLRMPIARWVEGVAAVGGLLLVAVWIFSAPYSAEGAFRSYTFPLFPFLVLAAVRYGRLGTTSALLVVSLVAIWYTGRGYGPFADPGGSRFEHLLTAQLFLLAMQVSVVTLAAVVTARAKAERELQQSRRQYRLVTDTIQEVFWVVTPDLSRVEYVSPGYERVWGRTCTSLYADAGELFVSIHPDDRARVMAERRLSGEQPLELEYRIVRPDGAVRWILTRSFPVLGPDDKLLNRVSVSRDVTARKQAEQAREATVADLQRAISEIKTLRGLVPICAWCRQIRDDDGYWQQLEVYLRRYTEADFTHCICPKCLEAQLTTLADAPSPGG